MGTDIQSKSYFPTYFSMNGPNDDAVNGMFALYNEDKSVRSGQYYDLLLTRHARDFGSEKDKVRQMILKHESIFRHQIHELHRVYKRQRDLMNEIKRRELCKHPMSAETSQSSLFLSHIPSDDAKKTWHVSNVPLADSAFGRVSASSIDSIQDTGFFKACGSFKSNCNTFQRRVVDIEIPADMHMNNEEKRREEQVCGVKGIESYSHERKHEVNLSLGSAFKSDCNGDALTSNWNTKRTPDLADLNEPIQVEETSVSLPVSSLDNITCPEEEVRRRDASANATLHFHFMSEEFSRSSHLGTDVGSCHRKLHSESERDGKVKLGYECKAGQTRSDSHSLLGGVCPRDPHVPLKKFQSELRKAHAPLTCILSDQSKTEPHRKRMIFGVEISEGTRDQSAANSSMPSLNPLSDVIDSESSFASSWRKTSSTFGQNVTSIPTNPCVTTFDPSGQSSNSLMPSLEFVSMHVNSNFRSIPSSRSDVSYENGTCLGSQADANHLQGCRSSIGFGFQCGKKSDTSMPKQFVQHDLTQDLEADVETPCRFQNEVIPQKNPVFADAQRNYENSKGGLTWLRAEPPCSNEHTEGRECSYHMNLDSLQHYSQHFFNKAETAKSSSRIFNPDSKASTCIHDADCRKGEISDSTSIKKNAVFPVFNVPHASKDLTPASFPSKSTCMGFDVDGEKSRNDFAHDLKSENQLESRDIVLDKGLDNYTSGLRNLIDLNLSVDEEAASVPTLPSAIVKMAMNEIDLEAPAVLESEMDISPEGPAVLESEMDISLEADNLENKSPSDKSNEPQEELERVAAEAIITISSSSIKQNLMDGSLDTSPSDCLQWFAEVISSHDGDHESKAHEILLGIDNPIDEESIPDDMDYFEFMTLKLKDTKGDEYCYKPAILESQQDEETRAISLPKRPRRGQARGRHRKDFQRDVLPCLVSLSRLEVTEDLHSFEELFRASGCTWKSSQSQRNAAKNGRGRRRLEGPPCTLAATAVCLPSIQQSIYREVGLDERSLTGWGKRTRRLPRQRCPTGNPSLSLKF